MSNPLLAWKDEYLIGVDELDYEHKDLFDRVNELYDELARRGDKAKIEDCLEELYARLEAHFALEERFMRDNHSPDYARHKKEHDSFLDAMVEAVEDFHKRSDLGQTDTLMAEVKRWVVDHIVTSDKEMGRARR